MPTFTMEHWDGYQDAAQQYRETLAGVLKDEHDTAQTVDARVALENLATMLAASGLLPAGFRF